MSWLLFALQDVPGGTALVDKLLDKLLDPQVLLILVPILVIIVGGLIAITIAIIRHRERMAMIKHGINPDDPSATDKGPTEQAEGAETQEYTP